MYSSGMNGLGRHIQFDERSRKYPVMATIDRTFPRSYTWSCGTVLDQGSEGACFPAGTLVRMADGSQKRIEDVRLLDVVATAEARTGVVHQTMVRHATELVELDLWGHRRGFRATPEHPVLVMRNAGSRRNPDMQTEYVSVSELKPDDLVALPRYKPTDDSLIEPKTIVDMTEFRGMVAGDVTTGGVTYTIHPLPPLIAKTVGFGRLIGLYAAEGSTTANKVVWSYSAAEEKTLVAETVELLKTCFDLQARLQYRPNNCINVVVYGKAWRRLFAALVPGTSKHGDKHLSSHVTSGSDEYRKAIFEGWIDGDGHRRRSSVQGVTVCEQLGHDMFGLALSIGLNPVIRSSAPVLNEYAKTRQQRYELEYGVGIATTENAKFVDTDAALWRKVAEIRTVQYDGPVYNLHVQGDESYIANSIGVHNCVGHAMTHELIARPAVYRGLDYDYAMSVYHDAQRIDPWPGGAYPGATERYEGTSVLAGVQVLQQRGLIDGYRWAFGVEDLAIAVSRAGPAVLGIAWYSGMYEPRGQYLEIAGEVVGGHAIMCHSYNHPRREFKVHNSWGRDWGSNGAAIVSWDTMNRLLSEQGEAVIPTKRIAQ